MRISLAPSFDYCVRYDAHVQQSSWRKFQQMALLLRSWFHFSLLDGSTLRSFSVLKFVIEIFKNCVCNINENSKLKMISSNV